MMDRKAEMHRKLHQYNLSPHLFNSSTIALRIDKMLIVGPVKKALLMKLSRPDMIQYLCQRNNWDSKMLDIIDFDAFGRYMKSLPNQRRTNVTKKIHNWQNMGR